MGTREVIQALRNLGDRALRDDLIDEYFRIHNPDPTLRKELLDKIEYKIGNTISPYLSRLRRDGTIDSILVQNTVTRKNQVEYFLVGESS